MNDNTTRNERFNNRMCSIDELCDQFDDISEIAALTDRGDGVNRLFRSLDTRVDGKPSAWRARLIDEYWRDQLLAGAILRLNLAKKRPLAATLLLIRKFLNDRDEIFRRVPERSYWRHLGALHHFFATHQTPYSIGRN